MMWFLLWTRISVYSWCIFTQLDLLIDKFILFVHWTSIVAFSSYITLGYVINETYCNKNHTKYPSLFWWWSDLLFLTTLNIWLKYFPFLPSEQRCRKWWNFFYRNIQMIKQKGGGRGTVASWWEMREKLKNPGWEGNQQLGVTKSMRMLARMRIGRWKLTVIRVWKKNPNFSHAIEREREI